ncbi:YceD family protein [Agrobacterium sp. ES01]|uniref:YceD family protein n=1 Tax=Agrobacterium sp. ES01 TaxID=3420714 RepID=UPI003D148030
MKTQNPKEGDTPFSYLVKVGHVSANPVQVHLEANEAERAGLAALWNVEAVNSLSADLQIARWKKDGIRIRGTLKGELVQACVVTLEPVLSRVDNEIEQIYVPEGSKLARIMTDDNGEMILDPEGPDIPEAFSGDTIDAGALVAEFAALSIDPYPKKPEAEFSDYIESDDEKDARPSPFAVLKDWKKD